MSKANGDKPPQKKSRVYKRHPRKIKNLLTNKNKWIKKDYAQTADGGSVSWDEKKACRWCLMGALWLVYSDEFLRWEVVTKVQSYLKEDKRFRQGTGVSSAGTIPGWNDHPDVSFEDVQKLLKDLEI